MTSRRVTRGKDGETARQLCKARGDSWTKERRATFLETLQATCNVSEAARCAGMSHSGVYELRRRDPGFAAGWAAALEQGYAELEMLLLRQSIHGSETVETIRDGSDAAPVRVKTVHGYPHAIALRLLLAHKDAVDRIRNRPGIERRGDEAPGDEIIRRIDAVRERLRQGADEGECGEAGK